MLVCRIDALRACLPAVTVSGAPKIFAMQIIDELEPHRRGSFVVAVGYFDLRSVEWHGRETVP